MGVVFQFFNLLEGVSVLENVVLPAVVAGTERRQVETRARHLVNLLGLADKAKDAPGVLSGGRLHAAGQTILPVTHDQDVADAGHRIVSTRDERTVDGIAQHAGAGSSGARV